MSEACRVLSCKAPRTGADSQIEMLDSRTRKTGRAGWCHALDERSALLFVLVITAVGAVLRLYHLERQSLWLDEYPGVAYLTAPDARTYFTLFQMYLPEQAQGPVYYFLQYAWSRVFGTDLFVLRLLPLFLGITAIPLLYMLGKFLYGSRAGLLAALCISVSPQHIWHAQEARPYSMITPLVIIALYSLLRARRESRVRWWGINLAVNCLLVWTHAFAVVVIGIEGLVLLALSRDRLRPAIVWASIQIVLLVPWLLWMAHMPFTYTGDMISHHHSVQGVFNGMFANDVVSRHSDLLPAWKSHPPEALSPNLRAVLSVRPAIDATMTLLLLCCPVWLLARLVHSFRNRRSRLPMPEVFGKKLEIDLLLLLLTILPALTLGVLTFLTKRPFLSPMYSMYNTIAIYLVLGALFAGLRKPSARVAALAFVTVLYAYQLIVLLPEVTRTNWRAAAAHLEEHASPDDLVLELEPFWPGEYLKYYLGGKPRSIERITTFQAACDRAAAFLSGPHSDREGRVWLAFEQAFISWLFPAFDAPSVLRQGLADRNLDAKHMEFPGHYNLQLYEISRLPGREPREIRKPVPGLSPLNYAALLTQIGASYPDNDRQASAEYALRTEIGIWPPMCRFFLLIHGLDLLERGEFELAETTIDHAIATFPSYALAHFAKGLARAARNDCAAAGQAFRRAFSLYPSQEYVFGAAAQALCEGDGGTKANAETKKLENLGTFFAPAMRSVWQARFGP